MKAETYLGSNLAPFDIEEASQVEVLIKQDGKVLWINTPHGCLVRLCRIKGRIKVIDQRVERRKAKTKNGG